MKFDAERAARVLADAAEFGDAKAAEKWKITTRTVENYRARLRSDPVLSGSFARIEREETRDWHAARRRFLRAGVDKLRELIAQAGPDQLDDVSKALERIGNLDVASEALGVGAERADREDEGAGEDEAPASAGAGPH